MTAPGADPSPPSGLSGRVLDTPAIVDLATGRTRYMRAVAYLAAAQGDTLAVPAAALAEASSAVGSDSGREQLAAAGNEVVVIVAMAGRDAIAAGELADKQRLSISAAHVGLVAAVRRWPIIARSEDAAVWRDLGYAVDVLP